MSKLEACSFFNFVLLLNTEKKNDVCSYSFIMKDSSTYCVTCFAHVLRMKEKKIVWFNIIFSGNRALFGFCMKFAIYKS
jgi:hypothetical protein